MFIIAFVKSRVQVLLKSDLRNREASLLTAHINGRWDSRDEHHFLYLQLRGIEKAALWWLLFGIEALVSGRKERHSKTHPPKAKATVGIAKCCLIL